MIRPFCLAALALTATTSFAGSAVVYRTNMPSHTDAVEISATFNANTDRPEKGLAWIELNAVEERDNDGPVQVQILNSKFQLPEQLPPLVYNATDRTVELSLPGHETLVCARVVTDIFGETKTEATGICYLQTREVRRQVETPTTGALRDVKMLEVILVTPYLM